MNEIEDSGPWKIQYVSPFRSEVGTTYASEEYTEEQAMEKFLSKYLNSKIVSISRIGIFDHQPDFVL